MLPSESRRDRRKARARRRPDVAVLERLEGRELLAYTPLGFSLPDLSVSGFAAPAAAWGGPLQVTIDVRNTGASTMVDPLPSIFPNPPSTADAAPTTVAVFATPRRNSLLGGIQIGTISIPLSPQNTLKQYTQTLTLPNQPRNFPGDGGKIFVSFAINQDHKVKEVDFTNDISKPVPVLIEAPFPQLEAVDLSLPSTMQPGDTIAPGIRIANLGTADTASQGPVTVALVASVDRRFGPGSSIVALYQVANIPAISTAPNENQAFDNENINPSPNIVTINGAPVTLPVSPRRYFVGVVVDPFNQIKQISRIGGAHGGQRRFALVRDVGPPVPGLSGAGVLIPGGGVNNPPFPFPLGTTTIGYGNKSGA